MYRQLLAFALLATTLHASADVIPSSVLSAVRAHLHTSAPTFEPTVLSEPVCASARSSTGVDWADFLTKYPRGIFVICDWQIKGKAATATILHFANTGGGIVQVSSEIIVQFSEPNDGAWQVVEWSEVVHDYALPLRHE